MLGIGRGVPALTGLGYTFLTTRPSLLVCVALYWVGGWGLARDIDLEESYRKERDRAEGLAREAEHAQLLALRSHLDPHFLFNTLNAIAEWCRQDGVVAEKAILELSAVLRTVMEGIKTDLWPLAREIELSEALIDLHRIRDPELFSYERVGDVPALDVPPLLLLPMSENAMKHGPHAGHRGKVTLQIETADDHVLVSLQNPGPFRGKREGGEGLGIVEARLRLTYEDRASFSIKDAEGATIATVRIPKGTK
jgi:LytS/YehU family sensor histidine kinase